MGVGSAIIVTLKTMKRSFAFLAPLIAIGSLVAAIVLAATQITWISEAHKIEQARVRQEARNKVNEAFGATVDRVRIVASLASELTRYKEDGEIDYRMAHERIAYWAQRSTFSRLLEWAAIVPERNDIPVQTVWPRMERSYAVTGVQHELEELLSPPRQLPRDPQKLNALVLRMREEGVLFLPADNGDIVILDIDVDHLLGTVLPHELSTRLTGIRFEIREGGAPFEGDERPVVDIPVWQALLSSFARLVTEPHSPGDTMLPTVPPRRIEMEIPLFLYLFNRSSTDLWQFRAQSEDELRLRVYINPTEIEQRFFGTRRLNIADAIISAMALLLSVFVLYRLYQRTSRLRKEEVRMLSAMSHELRTPLAVIESMSSNLHHQVVTKPERIVRYGTTIHEQSLRLRRMIEGILAFVRSDFRPEKRVAIDIVAVIGEIVQHTRQIAGDNRVSLSFSSQERCVEVLANEVSVQRVIENLVVNAIHYGRKTPQEHAEVRVRIVKQKRRVMVAVEDDGPGIVRAEQRGVFSAFVRGKQWIEPQWYRFGAFSCQTNDGRDWGSADTRESLPHDGGRTECGVLFPGYFPPPFRANIEEIERAEKECIVQRIFVVEDELGVQMALQDLLEDAGFSVECEDNGEIAEQRIRAERWDLVLLDVMLPGRDGFQVCQNLRENGIETPVIILTARDSNVDTVMGLRLGADDYVTKPFDPQILLARIHSILRRVEVNGEGEGNASGNGEIVPFASFTLDRRAKRLMAHDREVPLHAQEMRLLEYLIDHTGITVSRGDLLDAVWGYESEANTRTVDVHIARLRKRLSDADPVALITTVRGFGYRFDPPT